MNNKTPPPPSLSLRLRRIWLNISFVRFLGWLFNFIIYFWAAVGMLFTLGIRRTFIALRQKPDPQTPTQSSKK